jgi:hypothetical protein
MVLVCCMQNQSKCDNPQQQRNINTTAQVAHLRFRCSNQLCLVCYMVHDIIDRSAHAQCVICKVANTTQLLLLLLPLCWYYCCRYSRSKHNHGINHNPAVDVIDAYVHASACCYCSCCLVLLSAVAAKRQCAALQRDPLRLLHTAYTL